MRKDWGCTQPRELRSSFGLPLNSVLMSSVFRRFDGRVPGPPRPVFVAVLNAFTSVTRSRLSAPIQIWATARTTTAEIHAIGGWLMRCF